MIRLLTLAYGDGAKLQVAVPDPASFVAQVNAACGTDGATHAQFGAASRPVILALHGLRAIYPSLPGEFADPQLAEPVADVEVVASAALASKVDVTNVIQQPPMTLHMPDRRSVTAIERDSGTGEIVRSTTLETSVPDAPRDPASLN
jgi:hypothetical protein